MVLYDFIFFFFKQKTAYEMRISDWSSDVCSSDLDLALDTYFGLFWAPDLPFAANTKFVGDYKKQFKDTPTFYGAQSYDAINLIASAVVATKGNLKDKAAVQKALEAAKIDSVRGPFKFNTNHFPIEAIYQQEAYKAGDGEYDIRTISKIVDNLEDPYAKQCKM